MIKNIYLDANAQCISLQSAKEKLIDTLEILGNPSSFHYHGQAARHVLDEARFIVAEYLESSTKGVIFTSGASESNRLFLDSLLKNIENNNKNTKILCSIYEHPSLLKPIISMQNHHLCHIDFFTLANEYDVSKYDVIICTQAHNETGIIPDLDYLCNFANDNCLIMSDISQGLARLKKVNKRVDVLTASGQKMGAFSGCGLWVLRNKALELPVPYEHYAQERGYRGGTQALALIAAFAQSLTEIDWLIKEHEKLTPLRDFFEEEVLKMTNALVVGKNFPRLSNTSAIYFPHQNADSLRINMDLAGLSVGFGSACAGLAPQSSFALQHLLNKDAKSTVRFSFLYNHSLENTKEALARLKKIF